MKNKIQAVKKVPVKTGKKSKMPAIIGICVLILVMYWIIDTPSKTSTNASSNSTVQFQTTESDLPAPPQPPRFTPLPKKYDEKTLKKLQALETGKRDKWLGYLKAISDTLPNNNTVKEILVYLQNNLLLVRPSKEGMDFMEVKQVTITSRRFMILTEENRIPGSMWDSTWNQANVVAYYDPLQRTLFVKEDARMSDFIKAVTLVHEGYHAMNAKINDDHGIEERRAFQIQLDIMTALGGDAYKKVVDKEVQRLRDTVNMQKRKYQDVVFPSWAQYYRELDDIFGKALSEKDKAARLSLVNIQAIFNLLSEGIVPGDPEENKITYMRAHN